MPMLTRGGPGRHPGAAQDRRARDGFPARATPPDRGRQPAGRLRCIIGNGHDGEIPCSNWSSAT